jgi:microcystin-dependent protein
MRTKILSLLTGIIFLSSIVNAQINDEIKELGYAFQGYAVTDEGKALSNTLITVRFHITPAGFFEEHELASDVFGVFTAIVGSKNTPQFKAIDYSNLQSLRVEVTKTEASPLYITIYEGQMLSVPYAKHSVKAIYAKTADYANEALTANKAIEADFASTATEADSTFQSTTAEKADTAIKSAFAYNAEKAGKASIAKFATEAAKADTATSTDYAKTAGKVDATINCKIAAAAVSGLKVQYADTADLADVALVTETADDGVPVGTIIAYAGFSPPPGWLACDGTPLNDSEHSELKALINKNELQWQNNMTPDLRGRFLRGSNLGKSNIGQEQDEGANLSKIKTSQYYTLNKSVSLVESANVGIHFIQELYLETDVKVPIVNKQAIGDNISIDLPSNNQETRPITTAVLFIIKY